MKLFTRDFNRNSSYFTAILFYFVCGLLLLLLPNLALSIANFALAAILCVIGVRCIVSYIRGSVLEGVLSKSDLTVADLQGNWKSTGPSVCFQGDNFLKKAGGAAAATAIENKIAPYYNKYGLNGATLTVDKEGNFELAINKLKLKGTVSIPKGADKGVFTFSFKAIGKISLGNILSLIHI